jgi:guanylate kinase
VSLGIIFYGPPAAGKDTVTAALTALDPTCIPFQRLKSGPGRTVGYRMASSGEIDCLREAGELLWENHRYGAAYFVDRSFMTAELARGYPVLHLGQPAAITAVRSAFPKTRWLVVYLWCPREVAESRILDRGTGDARARIQAWEATPPIAADLAIDTAAISATKSAHLILDAVKRMVSTPT